MKQDSGLHQRRSIRLPGYDYSQDGVYFVTICTRNRLCLFGDVVNVKMVLNHAGRVVGESWQWMGEQYEHVELDEWVIMPNHLHGIIVISERRGGSRTAPTGQRKPLGRLIGAFKTVSTKHINESRKSLGAKLWQRNYYEHIIRDENEWRRIREYIVNNPVKWESDLNHPSDAREVFEPPQPYAIEPWQA